MGKHAVISHHEPAEGRLGTYIVGFVGSLALTLVAYISVVNHMLSRTPLIAVIISLAMVQFVIQLVFFLHLGTESKPRWKFLVFSFMLMVIGILVVGSLWIMNNLNYHTMSEHDLKNYMRTEEGL